MIDQVQGEKRTHWALISVLVIFAAVTNYHKLGLWIKRALLAVECVSFCVWTDVFGLQECLGVLPSSGCIWIR